MVRLACNRDEQHTRPAALPPVRRRFGSRWAVYPTDPVGDGTWVAVNDTGLALALLNANPELGGQGKRVPERSRGAVIPGLLSCANLPEALEKALTFDAGLCAPFRLVLCGQGEVAELRSCGERLRLLRRVALTAPCLFTSSGLGDAIVEGPRRRLFEACFGPADDWPERQDAFHRHSWPDRPHLSVCMRRRDARTVSYTVVTFGPETVSLLYHPDAPDRPAGKFVRLLPMPQEVGT
jgi:hypothetical protein